MVNTGRHSNKSLQNETFDGYFEDRAAKEERIKPSPTSKNNSMSSLKPSRSLSFPSQLHLMLREAPREGFDAAVSWTPNGDSFAIHNPDKFVNEVLPRYFKRQNKFKSFEALLNHWGFRSGSNGFKHACFVRDYPSLCNHMSRPKTMSTEKIKESLGRSSSSLSPETKLPIQSQVSPNKTDSALSGGDARRNHKVTQHSSNDDVPFVSGFSKEDFKYVLAGYKLATRYNDPNLLRSCLPRH